VQNPSFEENMGSLDGWIVDQNTIDFTITISNNGAPDGLQSYGSMTGHSAQMSGANAGTNPAAWMSQRMAVCPNTQYISDFNFLWTAITAGQGSVAANCDLQLGWGNYPGDTSNTVTQPWGALAGGGTTAPTSWVHVAWNGTSPITLPATGQNQTSAYLLVGMLCNPGANAIGNNAVMFIDTIQLYPPP
jgi:hypothetical protein